MQINDPGWMDEMRKSFEQGRSANSIFDNPYWKNYPKDSTTLEESMARWWVDGYASKLVKQNETNV